MNTPVRKEIPAKTKTYLSFGLWIMEKLMTEEVNSCPHLITDKK